MPAKAPEIYVSPYAPLSIARHWRPLERIETRDDIMALAYFAEWARFEYPYRIGYENGKRETMMRTVYHHEVDTMFDRAVEVCRTEDARRVREKEARQLVTNWICNQWNHNMEIAQRTRRWPMTLDISPFSFAYGYRASAMLAFAVASVLPPPKVQQVGIKRYLQLRGEREAREEIERLRPRDSAALRIEDGEENS